MKHLKLYRTIVRVEKVNDKYLEVVVPSWNSHATVCVLSSIVPDYIRNTLKPGSRLFAQVSIGAEKAGDLYFAKFELAPELRESDF